MSFSDLVAQDQRLVVLRVLEQHPDYTLNESIIQDCLARLGHKCSRDCVRTHIAWLREQGLVTVEDVVGVMVITLTARGLDVATGSAVVPGVKRPRPK